jgi:hypothetical protein
MPKARPPYAAEFRRQMIKLFERSVNGRIWRVSSNRRLKRSASGLCRWTGWSAVEYFDGPSAPSAWSGDGAGRRRVPLGRRARATISPQA